MKLLHDVGRNNRNAMQGRSEKQNPRELVEFYRNHGPDIFPGHWQKAFRWFRHWRWSKFRTDYEPILEGWYYPHRENFVLSEAHLKLAEHTQPERIAAFAQDFKD